jgi:ankyrin repeat protein
MARETFIDNPAEEDKNCSIHNIFTLLQNEEEVEELDVVLASTDSTAAGAGTVHVDYTDVANLLQWLRDITVQSWDDINAIDEDGWSALHYALLNKASREVIRGLVGKLDKTAINAFDFQGRSALHFACEHGASWKVINGLLGNPCVISELDEKAINAIDVDGRSALHSACEHGASLEIINGLLGKLDEKAINAFGNDGWTALHIACNNEASLEVINAIVAHKNGKEQVSIKNVNGKLPFDNFPDDKERRNEHLKKLLELHKLMEEKDPTASSYPNGLLQSILNLPSEDRDEFEFMNHSYFRKTINAKIIQPFSLSILFLDVAVQGLVMAVFSFTINGAVKELPTTSMAGLIPCLLWLLFREIVQYLSATAEFYFGDAANFVDLIQIVLVIAVLLISFIGKADIGEGLLVACIGVAWTRLIFVISNLHYSLALFVAALLQVSSSWYIEFTILAMM